MVNDLEISNLELKKSIKENEEEFDKEKKALSNEIVNLQTMIKDFETIEHSVRKNNDKLKEQQQKLQNEIKQTLSEKIQQQFQQA